MHPVGLGRFIVRLSVMRGNNDERITPSLIKISFTSISHFGNQIRGRYRITVIGDQSEDAA